MRFKIVAVADRKVGKTYMLQTYLSNRYPKNLPSIIRDYYGGRRMVNGKSYVILLYDLLVQYPQYVQLRTKCYEETKVFLLCFSVDSQASLSSVTSKWLPELREFHPDTPIILVALKTDLRTGANGEHCIPFEKGYNVAKHNHMYYMETSALMVEGLKNLIDSAIEIGTNAAKSRLGTERKKGPIPPLMPLQVKAPLIEIKTAVYGDQMAAALQDPQAADVVFLVEGVNKVKAHRVVLCSASDYFCQVFGIAVPVEQAAVEVPFEFTRSNINEGKVAGLSSIAEIEDDDGHQMTHITVSEDITFNIFSHVLEFLYTGLPKLEVIVDELVLKELRRVANIFHLPHLQEIAYNIEYKDEFLNPSIGTYLNDRMGQRAKALFLGKETFSDVKFNIQGTIVPAHMVMLKSRCDVMARMFCGQFTETKQEEVTMQDEDQEGFLCLLEYIYTEHAPIEGDSVGILTMADRYGEDRLKNLCELYIAKEIDRTVRDRIEKAKLDVIGILHGAQLHNADQLAKWCLHFISTNYQAFIKRPEFSQLDGDNKDYVTKNRWPSVSYLEEMKEYEALTVTGKEKKDKCKVM